MIFFFTFANNFNDLQTLSSKSGTIETILVKTSVFK